MLRMMIQWSSFTQPSKHYFRIRSGMPSLCGISAEISHPTLIRESLCLIPIHSLVEMTQKRNMICNTSHKFRGIGRPITWNAVHNFGQLSFQTSIGTWYTLTILSFITFNIRTNYIIPCSVHLFSLQTQLRFSSPTFQVWPVWDQGARPALQHQGMFIASVVPSSHPKTHGLFPIKGHMYRVLPSAPVLDKCAGTRWAMGAVTMFFVSPNHEENCWW